MKSFFRNHMEQVSRFVLFVERDFIIIPIVSFLRNENLNSGNLSELI